MTHSRLIDRPFKGAATRRQPKSEGHVRNVGGNITTLGLNNGKRGEGSSAELVGHLGGSLEQSRVEVEDISGVGLSTGRSSEKKRHLSVGDGLLGKIVVDDASVLAVVSEPLSHGATREGSEVLKRSSLGGGGSDDDAIK